MVSPENGGAKRFFGQIEKENIMGDKGGKKDKEKDQKQNSEKKQKSAKNKLDKQPKRKP